MKRNFLVVTADGQRREALATGLSDQGLTVTRVASGDEAERVVSNVEFDVVLVDSELPDMPLDKLRACIKQASPGSRFVVLTGAGRGKNKSEPEEYKLAGGQIVDLLGAPFREDDSSMSGESRRASEALMQVVDVLVGVLELDDKCFGGSSHKVMRLAREVAEELSADDKTVNEIVIATLLRDVGKVGVEAEILSEQGSYSDEQKEQMKEHVTASLRLFEHIDFPWKVIPVIRHHHERYDGEGYPDGLRGREIPMGSRVIAVVDAYVALTSSRLHRKAVDPEDALRELIGQTGRQFDPEVIEAFQKVLDKRGAGRVLKEKPRIVIADAQEDFRRTFKMRLLNEGLEVSETTTCEGALAFLFEEPPDLVLVDLDSDTSEAFQMFREIRADKGLCRVPVAFLSRKANRVLKIRALREGVDDFMCKTEDLEELVARVQNILIREAMRQADAPRRARRGITGDLENLSLPDIVQTLAMGMKTACLTISSDDRQGQIWFENGSARDAQTDEAEGEAAFFEMVRWTSGEFVIEHGVRSQKERLKQDPMYLLMEGLRLLDESNQNASAAS